MRTVRLVCCTMCPRQVLQELSAPEPAELDGWLEVLGGLGPRYYCPEHADGAPKFPSMPKEGGAT